MVATAFLAVGHLTSCSNEISEDDLASQDQPRVNAYFNYTGAREGTQRDEKADEVLVEMIDRARSSVHACAYGFSKQNVIDAMVRAHKRGVDVKIAGDAGHMVGADDGFQAAIENEIPIVVGNEGSIMHNKIFIIDGRFTFAGTGNITPTGFERNDNNWVIIDSVPVAQDFEAEFQQMFAGRFSVAKEKVDNGTWYPVGDTEVEIFFSPQEDAMGKIYEEVEAAESNVIFQIFAFTKDELGSDLVQKHREFMKFNEQAVESGKLPADYRETMSPLDWPYKVIGALDRSQLHGNDQYHEGYRLLANGIPMRLDANENSRLPGDYQAGGGRLHTKTMILDYGTPQARVITGSFNWSSSATNANDEFLLVLHGERIAERYMETFRELWGHSRGIPGAMCYYMAEREDLSCTSDVEPGDVVLSEVHWDGWNGILDKSDHNGPINERNEILNDQFVELYNTTDKPINLSMWTLNIGIGSDEEGDDGFDFVVGFTPGTVIEPGEHFLVLDHNTEVYSERDPQRGTHAFRGADFVLNRANDPRFPRLDLKYGSMYLDLRDASARIIDQAGNGGSPLAGGRLGEEADQVAHSAERLFNSDGTALDGTSPDAWKPCTGGDETNINPEFRDIICATPGMPNSQ
jgi:phosphatidylserine/phosphatidylglycerophosphate/cardiolipin synthase-like enzyme